MRANWWTGSPAGPLVQSAGILINAGAYTTTRSPCVMPCCVSLPFGNLHLSNTHCGSRSGPHLHPAAVAGGFDLRLWPTS